MSIRDAAGEAKLGERTAHRRLDDPVFRARVKRLRHRMLDEAVGRITAAGSEAVDTLRGLLSSDDDGIRLRAAAELAKSVQRMNEAEHNRSRNMMSADEVFVFAQAVRDAVEEVVPDPELRKSVAVKFNELVSQSVLRE